MYIDSGADLCLFPRQFGEALGLVLSKDNLQEIRGIGSRGIPVSMTTVNMRIGKKIVETRVAHCLTEDVPLILGRMDVFDNFKIKFDQAQKIVTFQS